MLRKVIITTLLLSPFVALAACMYYSPMVRRAPSPDLVWFVDKPSFLVVSGAGLPIFASIYTYGLAIILFVFIKCLFIKSQTKEKWITVIAASVCTVLLVATVGYYIGLFMVSPLTSLGCIFIIFVLPIIRAHKRKMPWWYCIVAIVLPFIAMVNAFYWMTQGKIWTSMPSWSLVWMIEQPVLLGFGLSLTLEHLFTSIYVANGLKPYYSFMSLLIPYLAVALVMPVIAPNPYLGIGIDPQIEYKIEGNISSTQLLDFLHHRRMSTSQLLGLPSLGNRPRYYDAREEFDAIACGLFRSSRVADIIEFPDPALGILLLDDLLQNADLSQTEIVKVAWLRQYLELARLTWIAGTQGTQIQFAEAYGRWADWYGQNPSPMPEYPLEPVNVIYPVPAPQISNPSELSEEMNGQPSVGQLELDD